VASCFVAACSAQVQTYPSIQEVRVSGLPTLTARTHDPSDVLLTSLDTIIHDRRVCCGKDSALEDAAQKADLSSLKDIAAKLRSGQRLADGRPIVITAESIEPTAINSGMLVASLRDKHALLFEWNSHLYVCYGVTYVRDVDYSTGMELNTINKFLLLDTRYSDSRREVVFNRETDNWNKVQGMLRLTVEQQ
jgi:hypothetical protein